jgi:hypothetical protein
MKTLGLPTAIVCLGLLFTGLGATATPARAEPLVAAQGGFRLPAVGRAQILNDFKQLGLLYHTTLDTSGKPPANLADWKDLKKEFPKGYKAIEEGRYVFYFNVSLKDMKAGTSNTVLAYEKDAPTRGGVVLMGDGSVKTLTADEFAKAPKAKGE